MGVCASLAACLCFPVCLCLLCFEANKYDDDDDDDWCVRGNWSTLDTRKSRRAQNAGVSERQQISRPRRARFIVLLVTTATARAVHSQASLHHFAAAAAHTQQVAAVADGPARRAALRPSRRTHAWFVGWLVGWSRV